MEKEIQFIKTLKGESDKLDQFYCEVKHKGKLIGTSNGFLIHRSCRDEEVFDIASYFQCKTKRDSVSVLSLLEMTIIEKYRGNGIGKRFFDWMLKEFQTDGIIMQPICICDKSEQSIRGEDLVLFYEKILQKNNYKIGMMTGSVFNYMTGTKIEQTIIRNPLKGEKGGQDRRVESI
ncbi:hypothetical protein [Sulfurimonas indica]|nr:hypothetical protein [Sulfurimonas indica]